MAENILFLLPIGTHAPVLELNISYADNLIKSGNNVTFLACGAKKDACHYNPLGLSASCNNCKKRTRKGLGMLSGDYNLIETKAYNTPSFSYQNIDELKSITHLGTSIGYAALSTYASLTQSANIDFNNSKTKKIINHYLHTACQLAETTNDLIKKFEFNRFVLFNSRLNTYRSFFDIAVNQNIPVDVLEFNFNKESAMIFKDAMPHSISRNAEKIEELYETTGFEMAEELADTFFNNRAHSIFSNEESYTQSQESNLMPSCWDDNCKNIVIFNSSEHEFMAIGGEWESEKLFSNQYDGLKFLSSYAKSSNSHFYLRIHPNLAGKQRSYLSLLLGLNHSKFTVIPAHSKVSTYSLLFKCDQVITFGSSTGVEATYWGKPSILLGTCFYKHLGVSYTPETIDKLIELLESNLKPINNKVGCIKIANHWLNPGIQIPGYSFKNGEGYVNGQRIPKEKSILRKLESKKTKYFLKELK